MSQHLTIEDFENSIADTHNSLPKALLLQSYLLHLQDNIENLEFNELFYANLASKPNADSEIKQKYNKIVQKISKYKQAAARIESQLENIANAKAANETKLIIPPFGQRDEVDTEELKIASVDFDGKSNVTIEEFWNKLSNYCSMKGFSEKACKEALSTMLHSEAFKIFHAKKNESLEVILKCLTARYGPLKSVEDYVLELDNFSRHKNENIESCIIRLEILLDKTETSVPVEERKTRKELLMNKHIMAIAHEKAKEVVVEQKSIALKQGIILSNEDIFEIIKTKEKNIRPKKLTISALDACPKQDDQENLFIHSLNYEDN